MKKSEFWNRIFIPITKRLPPEDKTKQVLLWNPIWKQYFVMESHIARYGGIAILNRENISTDRFYNKWCLLIPPKKK